MWGTRTIELLESSRRGVAQHDRPNVFALANPDGITMPGRLVAMEKGVRTTHDHRNPPGSELVRDIVSPEGIDRPCGNGHQIYRGMKVDVHQLFVDQFNGPIASTVQSRGVRAAR
jgi:hypothetical protein